MPYNQITHPQSGDPETGKSFYHRGSPPGVRILSARSGSPVWASGHWEEEPPAHLALKARGA